MAISLAKGQRISLEKVAEDLGITLPTVVDIELHWKERATDGKPFDLDASLLLLNEQGKVNGDFDFCCYAQKTLHKGAVVHQGDNRTGGGETIRVNLATVPANSTRAVAVVTIFEHDLRHQTFGQVDDAYVLLKDASTGTELLRFDLTDDMSTQTAMLFCELYRKNNGWSFNAVGQGYEGGLKAIATNYGVDVE